MTNLSTDGTQKEARKVRSVVMFSLTEDVDDATWSSIRVAMADMWNAIPEVASWQIEVNSVSGPQPPAYTHALVLEFNSESDFQIYQNHPLHHEVGRAQLASRFAGRPAQAVLLTGPSE